MNLREYIAGKAVSLCFVALAAICWGVFAALVGAGAVLLWGSEIFIFAAGSVCCVLGFVTEKRKIEKLERQKEQLAEKYLLGEILPEPYGAVEKKYFEVMRSVSRSAIGAVEEARREKEEYCDYVEQWLHEIKTPLTACSLICDNGADKNKLKRELKRADNLTDTILYYARLRSAEKDRVISEASAAQMIAEAVQSQRELLVAAGIGVDVSGDICVNTDRKAVCFVLRQLLINCAKYCRGSHVNISAHDGEITVADNGAGISAHELPRIFDRGFTGESGRKAHGTGMGLYISKEICKRADIEISAKSQVGKGSQFTLRFPA